MNIILFNFIYLLFIGQYVPLSSARQNKESEKGLFNTNKKNKYKDICKSCKIKKGGNSNLIDYNAITQNIKGR